MSTVEIETARSQWHDAHRRVEAARGDRTRYHRLHTLVDAVTDELRRRIGEHFTISELVGEYGRAERWSRPAAAAAATSESDLHDLALIEDAAFHLYARRALDYEP